MATSSAFHALCQRCRDAVRDAAQSHAMLLPLFTVMRRHA